MNNFFEDHKKQHELANEAISNLSVDELKELSADMSTVIQSGGYFPDGYIASKIKQKTPTTKD